MSASNVHSIPFVKKSGLMLIEASIDGQKGNFVFDTGADGLYLNNNRHSQDKSIEIETINGITTGNSLTVNELRIGSLSINTVDALGIDLKDIESLTGSSISGIIGARLINNEILRIDNVSNRLFIIPRELMREGLLAKSLQCSFELENDLPIVNVSIDNHAYKFILDTGSTSSSIDKRFLRSIESQFINLNKEVKLLTVSGQSIANAYKLRPFILAGITIKEMEFMAVDLSYMKSNFDSDIKGIIAIDKLPYKEIFVDFEKNKLHFLF